MAVSSEDLRKARQTDLLSYLQLQNEIAINKGETAPYRIEVEKDQYRLKDHGGLLFKRNMWNQRNTRIGGNTLDFLMKIEGKSFTDAVSALLEKDYTMVLKRVDLSIQPHKPEVPFVLPEKNDTFRRAIAYLTKTRGLDANLVLGEIKRGSIYEDKEYHNVVFVGRDLDDKPMWAQKRTTLSDRKLVLEQEGSNPSFTYEYGDAKTAKIVVVTESPIEALSLVNLMKLHNKDISNYCFKSLGGVHDTALRQYLKDHPHCKGVITALNNDRGKTPHEIKGHEASKLIKDNFDGKGWTVGSIFPKANDWNDDLRAIRLQENEKKIDSKAEKDVETQIKEYARSKQKQRDVERGPVRVKTR